MAMQEIGHAALIAKRKSPGKNRGAAGAKLANCTLVGHDSHESLTTPGDEGSAKRKAPATGERTGAVVMRRVLQRNKNTGFCRRFRFVPLV
jgi:hypothetical protein